MTVEVKRHDKTEFSASRFQFNLPDPFAMITIFFLTVLFMAYIKKKVQNKPPKSLEGKHVVITGGSSGIGKCVGLLAAKMGAHVTIIARNAENLNEAVKEIQKFRVRQSQSVVRIAMDVCDSNQVTNQLTRLDDVRPIYMLVNCAGLAVAAKLEDTTSQDIRAMVNVNLLGTMYAVKALISQFKKRNEGIIVVTASLVSLTGMFGYSVYAGCKFALRGFAESIAQELKPFDVSVTVALPPDMDTPGFEREGETKPTETKLITETGSLQQPEGVAEKLLDDALNGKFFSHVGWQSYALTTLCIGMSPFVSLFEVLIQALILGPLRLVGAYYASSFEETILRVHEENERKLLNDL